MERPSPRIRVRFFRTIPSDPRSSNGRRRIGEDTGTLSAEAGAVGARLRGVDWFAWATCGGSNVVILTTETGVAEVFVTADGAWILTDEIEAARLAAEEVPSGFEIWAGPWNDPSARQAFV